MAASQAEASATNLSSFENGHEEHPVKVPKEFLTGQLRPGSPKVAKGEYDERTPRLMQHAHQHVMLEVAQTKSSSSSSSCSSIGAYYCESAVLRGWAELSQVTGEPGDVQRHPTLAYGESSLTFKDVAFSIQKSGIESLNILDPISGHFEPGTLVALMGPSGCGKTTLLDILAAKKSSPYRGTVHLNGRPRDHLFRRLASYISQDDIMFANITVKEAVMFHTLLKTEMPSRIDSSTLLRATMMRLLALGLEEVADVRIGNEHVRGISGGQRRRVSLACGLATGAQLFFCDEPTSGLSATDAETAVRFMRLLAKKFGVTIVVAIHQPRVEVARLFDHLVLMAANPGTPVYNGPLSEARSYWAHAGFPVPEFANPTDYYLDLVTDGHSDSQAAFFISYYKESMEPTVQELVNNHLNAPRKNSIELLEAGRQNLLQFGDLPPIRNSVYGVRFRRQLRLVFWRQLVLSLRDMQGLVTDLIIAVVKALVVGIAYVGVGTHGPNFQVGFYFMVVMTCALDGIKVVPKTIADRFIMKLETSEALYNDWAYILAFSIINGFFALLSNTIFVALVFLMSQLNWDVFPGLLLWTTLVYVAMDSVYQMVAAIAKDSSQAQLLLLPFLLVFLLYNGFTASRNSVPSCMVWALRISPVAQAMEEVVTWSNFALDGELQVVVDLLGYTEHSKEALGYLVAFVVFFRSLQVICLKMLNSVKR